MKKLFLLPALIAGLTLLPAKQMTAQTFTVLHTFTGYDGAYPQGGLILSGKTLYGTASNGGGGVPLGPGAVFAVNTDGTGFTNLHGLTESEGGAPLAGLVLSGNSLYGTSSGIYNYGVNQNGAVFKINTNGTGFTTLHGFTVADDPYASNSDGARPYGGLILSGNTLYGTASHGGSFGHGTIFKVNTNGTGFTTLHNFTPLISGEDSGGNTPRDGLILSGDTLYGTARSGGGPDNGTVFRIKTNGTGFTNLHSFYGLGGATPTALILSSNILYGTTAYGGSSDNGTVFKLNTNGTGFTVLYSFTAFPFGLLTNSDGAYPRGLILSGNTLYGTASGGGTSGAGTVFALNTDGTGFKNLYTFTINNGSNSDGAYPWAELILSGNTLYGTANGGGSLSYGTVFSLSFAPQLTINRSGANAVLTWPTNFAGFDYAGFTLQSTTNLVFPNSWSPVAQTAVTNAGQISITVPTTVERKFFRLKSQ